MGDKAKLRYNVAGCKDTPFGGYIRQRLKDLGMTPGDLSRKLHISTGRVSQLFTSYTEKRVPTITTLMKLAVVLETTPETLMKEILYRKEPS